MRTPIFVRRLSEDERRAVEAGLRAPAAFSVRRSQIILASMRGTACRASLPIWGVMSKRCAMRLWPSMSRARRPKSSAAIFTDERAEQLKQLLHRSPREYGKATSLWMLELAAEVSFAEGLTPRLVSGDCIRLAPKRLKVSWKRAKHGSAVLTRRMREKKEAGSPLGAADCAGTTTGLGLGL